MALIEVRSPGLETTVQDLGREGYGPLGVSPSGAADPMALVIGNRLVGNPDNAAGLEMTLLGGTFLFRDAAVIAITGSDFDPRLDGAGLPLWTSLRVASGQTLRFGGTRSGARCYLLVHGGIAVPRLLGSASTHLLSGLGGFEGRALQKGDLLPVGPASSAFRRRTVRAGAQALLAPRKELRATPGPQRDWFTGDSLRAFHASPYRVTEDSNRMGLRLAGPPLEMKSNAHLISEGAPLGAIQVPAGGQPIILFVEQQTAGGYPKVANIISCDLASIGQLRPRDEIHIDLVTFEAARAINRERARLLEEEGLIEE